MQNTLILRLSIIFNIFHPREMLISTSGNISGIWDLFPFINKKGVEIYIKFLNILNYCTKVENIKNLY